MTNTKTHDFHKTLIQLFHPRPLTKVHENLCMWFNRNPMISKVEINVDCNLMCRGTTAHPCFQSTVTDILILNAFFKTEFLLHYLFFL